MTETSRVTTLSLQDFRCFEEVSANLGAGLTVLRGDNGEGKTSLLEGIGWIARGRSIRGVGDSALVRVGARRAIIRARIATGERLQSFAAEIQPEGRSRIVVNDNAVARRRDLVGLLRVTVFTPDDLELVKGGPAGRRDFLDELAGSVSARYEQARTDYERVVRQRNALLKQGIHDGAARSTLDVFDESLVVAGAEIVSGRIRLSDRLEGLLGDSYAGLAGDDEPVAATYQATWTGVDLAGADKSDVIEALREALTERRREELDRRVSLVGPHRDEWHLMLGGMDARTHASQGEQRSLSLAMRLAGHLCVREITGETPVLLLDDVFSELDVSRGAALVARLPAGQTLLTTASTVPESVDPEQILEVRGHRLAEATP